MYLGVSLTSLVLLVASGNQVQAKVFAKLSMGKLSIHRASQRALMLLPDLNCYELGKQWNVEKENCMTGEAAQTVAFTKIKNTGPFCLTAYSDYACKGSATKNQYEITGSKLACYHHRFQISLCSQQRMRQLADYCRRRHRQGLSTYRESGQVILGKEGKPMFDLVYTDNGS